MGIKPRFHLTESAARLIGADLFKGQVFFLCFFCGFMLLAPGCATVQGPVVRREEINEETKQLEVKRLTNDIEQMRRINQIGLDLLGHIPAEDIKVHGRPYIGLNVLPVNRITNRLFDQYPQEGVYIGPILQGTPMAKADIQEGDVLIAFNEEKIKDIHTVLQMMKKAMHHDELKAGDVIVLHILRQGEEREVALTLEGLPVDVSFSVRSDETVNALSTGNHIAVTQGMLNFIQSDDELAAILSHELAHIVRGHLKRKVAGSVFNSVIAISLGVTTEVFVPGTGDLVRLGSQSAGEAIGRRFSRDLEREADYFGMKYYYRTGYDPEVLINLHERMAVELPNTLVASFLNSHPISSERKVRMRKTLEQIQRGEEFPLADSY